MDREGQEKDKEAIRGFKMIKDKIYPNIWDQVNIKRNKHHIKYVRSFIDLLAFLVVKEVQKASSMEFIWMQKFIRAPKVCYEWN